MTAWGLAWLWQGGAVVLGVGGVLACARRLNAATRHLIWYGALLAIAWLGWASSPYRALIPVPVRGSDPIYVPSAPDLFVTIFLGVWAAVALVRLLRLLPGVRALYALRDRCRPFPSSVESQLPLWLEADTRGRRTQLMLCDAVPGATVLGLERPCIAIPSALVDALTIDELDQVILHEHAHVQRRDDWSRLAQTLLLSVLWIHPAALLVSRALDREREMACDEWVVARTGSPKAYARCLARAAEVRLGMGSVSALVHALLSGRQDLVRRVDRLLAIRGPARRSVSLGAAAVAACAMVMVTLHVQSVRFAEIAEIILPNVSAPMRSVYDGATIAVAEMPVMRRTVRATTVRLKADPTDVAALDVPRLSARVFSGAYDAPLAPLAPNAPLAPSASNASAFAATAHIATADKPNPWSTAKKTGIGFANVFSRAGVSLARRF